MTIRLRNTLLTPSPITDLYEARVFLVSPNGSPTLISSGAALPTTTPIVTAVGILAGADLQYTTTAIPENDEITPAGTYYQIIEVHGDALVGYPKLVSLSGYADNTIVVVPTVLDAIVGTTLGFPRAAPIMLSTGTSSIPSLTAPVLPGGYTPSIGDVVNNYNTQDPVIWVQYVCVDVVPVVWQEVHRTSKPWNMPWGFVDQATDSAAQTLIGTSIIDLVSLTVTYTAIANRRYKITAIVRFGTSSAALTVYLILADAASSQLDAEPASLSGGAWEAVGTILFVETPTAGSVTRKLRAVTTTGTVTGKFGGGTARLLIEDIGPNGLPA